MAHVLSRYRTIATVKEGDSTYYLRCRYIGNKKTGYMTKVSHPSGSHARYHSIEERRIAFMEFRSWAGIKQSHKAVTVFKRLK